jgi:hypothetical protein
LIHDATPDVVDTTIEVEVTTNVVEVSSLNFERIVVSSQQPVCVSERQVVKYFYPLFIVPAGWSVSG